MAKMYRGTLTPEEREALGRMISRGKADARKLAHARVLLRADEAEGRPARADEAVASALDVSVRTVERVRQRLVRRAGAGRGAVAQALEADLCAQARWGAGEAHLIAPACSTPPEGKGRWTLRRLAERMVELGHVDAPRRTRRRAPGAQQNELRPHLRRMWCIPPRQSAEFVYHMEDVLEVYRRPYDPKRPVVCPDETRSGG